MVLVDEEVKGYKTYEQQVDLHEGRGMDMGDRECADEMLRRVT